MPSALLTPALPQLCAPLVVHFVSVQLGFTSDSDGFVPWIAAWVAPDEARRRMQRLESLLEQHCEFVREAARRVPDIRGWRIPCPADRPVGDQRRALFLGAVAHPLIEMAPSVPDQPPTLPAGRYCVVNIYRLRPSVLKDLLGAKRTVQGQVEVVIGTLPDAVRSEPASRHHGSAS